MPKQAKRERQKENRERARVERERLQRRDRRLRAARNFLILLVPVVAIAAIFSITNGSSSSKASGVTCTDKKPTAVPPKSTTQPAPPTTIDPAKTYTALFSTSCGLITAQLDAKTAPVATNNFVFLARQRFYDGLTWHRAAKDFVIQGGDPKGDGTGGPGYEVRGETPTDHYQIGSLAAAKSQSAPAGSFGSQFFVVTGTSGATLPKDYARFGQVTKGLNVAQKLASFAPRSGDGRPTRPLYIFSVRISESGGNTPSSTTAPRSSAP